MNKETEKVIKEIVNKNYPCKKCRERKYCEFGEGDNTAFDCNEDCLADEFANGICATLKYLGEIPWNEAMKAIVNASKEDKQ